MEAKVGLSAPWYTYHHMVVAMFGSDPEIKIRELGATGGGEYSFIIHVKTTAKAEALKRLVIQHVPMGNLTINITILGPDENKVDASNASSEEIINNAFSGNPIFVRTENVEVMMFKMLYCIFKKEVIQFFNDDLTDYKRNYSGLAHDIAYEIFDNENLSPIVNYCICSDD